MKKVIYLIAIAFTMTAFKPVEKENFVKQSTQTSESIAMSEDKCYKQYKAEIALADEIYYENLALFGNVPGGVAYANWVDDGLYDTAKFNLLVCDLLEQGEKTTGK